MRLLFYSPAFLPQVGGLEIFVATLAGELTRRGQEVVVVTTTPGSASDDHPFAVVRRPGPLALLRLTRWCDVYFQANVSLRGLWPLLLVRRSWVVSHHSWYCRSDGRIAWQDRLKRRLVRRAVASIAVSTAVAEDLDTPSQVIGNPYRDDLFRLLPQVERSRELVFVGRLVSDKGMDLLVEALAHLAAEGLRPGLTVVGEGPEAPRLREQSRRSGVEAQIDFLSTRTGGELVEILNRHRILVVPSRYREPFGIVALEGIACGCVVVGSAGGGLPEAMGPCGRTFPNGDSAALARVLRDLLSSPGEVDHLRQEAEAHLVRHRARSVGQAYLRTLERVTGQGVSADGEVRG